MVNPYPFKIVTISGPDRTGKTTQVRLLSEALKPSKSLKFPHENTWSNVLIRSMLGGSEFFLDSNQGGTGRWWAQNLEPYTMQYLQAIGRQQLQPEIRRLLQSGHVLMDRYDVDCLLYGTATGLSLSLCQEIIAHELESDLAILLYHQGPPALVLCRDRYDGNPGLQEQVMRRGIALTALVPERYVAMDVGAFDPSPGGSKLLSIWEIHQRICATIRERLELSCRPLDLVRVRELLDEA